MQYYQISFNLKPCDETHQDLLCAMLGEAGFETFVNTQDGINAWIQRQLLHPDQIKDILLNDIFQGIAISYDIHDAPDEDWNKIWEQEGFKPIVVSLTPDPSPNREGRETPNREGRETPNREGRDYVCIHDLNHTDVPKCQYDIVINPCQAFGTGSHETTRMILRQLSQMDITGLDIVDAGTGTGILSIMCRMLGCSHVFAYDIDQWSVDNAKTNLQLNNIDNVDVVLGDSRVLAGHKTDILIANINRNILLGDMQQFASSLNPRGRLLLSGFYLEDVPLLDAKAKEYGLNKLKEAHDSNWTMCLWGKSPTE